MAVSLEGKAKVAADSPYFNVGHHEYRISTQSQDAQTWFNRGLTWAYSFNHRESAACFQQVISHDPKCAMGYWGVAYASGPNYNKVWMAFDTEDLQRSVQKCHLMAQKAQQYAHNATPTEQALIDAIQKRYPSSDVPSDFTPSVEAYADAMRHVYRAFGAGDLDVAALVADALMNTAPWKLYHARTGQPNLATPVLEIHDILERAIADRASECHPGVLHYYIHLTEMSDQPEQAVKSADLLRDIVPDGGHMHHMPSHIDVLVGDYRRAMHTNLKATLADEKYLLAEGAKNFYSFYRMHNYHSLIYAAMMAGNKKQALEATSRMEFTITEDLLRMTSPPMADWLEVFNAVRVHVLIRFGMWEELKAMPIPVEKDLYCVTIAMRYYGRGIAYAATGNVQLADDQRFQYKQAIQNIPESRLDFPNKITDVLKVATAMLDGEIEYRRGNYENAFESLRQAIEHDDALVYSEPWGWMLPTRHPYAALLLEQGHIEEASVVYAQDLGYDSSLVRAHQHPNNIWALHGYLECLKRLGRQNEAKIVQKQLSLAEAGADVLIESSCFCRRGTGNESGCQRK
ncbi:TPR domain-containing protein [Colletotrichum simmondsii]|uniref:TPR domain-containing protein n=1 Tax=Colletotrichum simmondsii TaxID=703756 RepID=A0A135T7M5_9PEZI|nr:TPR domain-containing protein [Colletotrichum simmondsii]